MVENSRARSSDQPPPPLGARIRSERKARRLTLDDMAARSGVSKSMLSQIERGKVNPTFVVLWNLTLALGIEFADLVGGTAGEGRKSELIEHRKAYATPVIKSADGLCELRILSPTRTILPIEWYEVRFQPAGVLASEPHAVGTFEYLTCFDGVFRITLGGNAYEIQEGETAQYFADQPRRIENPGRVPARGILVVALPAAYETPRR